MGQSVDGAAERLVRLRLPVEPHELGLEQDLREAQGHPGPVAGVLRARLEDEHPALGVLGKSRGDDGSCRAAANDHIVIVL